MQYGAGVGECTGEHLRQSAHPRRRIADAQSDVHVGDYPL